MKKNAFFSPGIFAFPHFPVYSPFKVQGYVNDEKILFLFFDSELKTFL